MKVFVADTDSLSISKLERSLSMSGFACEKAIISGKVPESLFHYLVNGFKGVVVLGAGLDDDLKESWIRQCRKSETVFPVLVVTQAKRRDSLMKFNEAGMTDFICLPLRPDELVTRISLLIRQVYPSDYAANVFRNGPFVFSRFPNKVLRDGKEIELTVKEFELACLLFRHIGQPLSRVTIEETIWFSSENELCRTIDTHVSRVRNKLDLKEEHGYRLQQVYGYGYQLVEV